MQGLKSTKTPPYPLPVNGAVCGGLPSIMLELEPSGGGAVIARRTVYSNRGRQMLLD